MKEKREASEMRRILTVSTILLLCLLIFSTSAVVDGQEEPIDTDGDGMPDEWEETYGLNVTDPSDAQEDPDNDGLINLEEFNYRIYPFDPDSDNDGMTDGWEVENGLDPKVFSAQNDSDGDGYPDLDEFQNGTDPNDRNEPSHIDDDPCCVDNEDAMGAQSSICFLASILIVGAVVFFMILGFYSKIKKDKLLDHKTRQKMMDFIRENPGTYYSQIRKELDLAHGVVTHHLNIMETQELIFSKQDRQFRRFYVDGLYKDSPMVTGTQKRVLDEVRRYPGLSQKQISDHLELYPMIVSYHVGQLESLELVEKRKKGRSNLLYAANKNRKKDDREIFGRGPFEGPAPEMGITEN